MYKLWYIQQLWLLLCCKLKACQIFLNLKPSKYGTCYLRCQGKITQKIYQTYYSCVSRRKSCRPSVCQKKNLQTMWISENNHTYHVQTIQGYIRGNSHAHHMNINYNNNQTNCSYQRTIMQTMSIIEQSGRSCECHRTITAGRPWLCQLGAIMKTMCMSESNRADHVENNHADHVYAREHACRCMSISENNYADHVYVRDHLCRPCVY